MHRFHNLHIFRDYFLLFRDKRILSFFFFFFFFFLGGGDAVEVILEGFISGTESFHIIYFLLSLNYHPKA